MEPRYKACWLDNGIYHAIICSIVQPQADSPLLGSALVFWNSVSNTFDFWVGPMSISILDLAVIFGFRPHGRSVDWLGDFEGGPSQEKERKKNLEVLISLIGSNRAYGAFMGTFMDQEVDNPEGEHVMFLLYWLNRFPKLSKDDLLGVRAKIRESARILELRPYHPDCCCTQSFQICWDHCLSKYGPLHEVYPRAFKNCPFRRDLKGEDKRILLEQIAEDNQLSLTGARVATKKTSQPEEAGSGAKEKAQSKLASSKRAKISSVKVPKVSASSSPSMVPPPSIVLPSDGSEGRAAEVGSAAEVAGLVPQVKEARGEGISDVDNRTEVTPDTSIPVAEDPAAEIPAEKNGPEGNAPDDDASRVREDVPKIPAATPAAEPSSGSASAKAPGDLGSGSSDSTFISNARAKILLGKWLALPLEDKVADEQGAKVSNALDSICLS
ncbi:uncharacterized protein Pyn_04914 [Prunus yedoensis var. nudiflora]|uniref:Aminotransferase-like plant mobile domain-containing protein n=1 Tax=Prunus yedoensis var. nudiflora TaxID=2094558 RepID=A0A314YND0_PRUYE|nr:uncharacterized protein Pyn_04914 [Prunus yedoensis var. nudiflora]